MTVLAANIHTMSTIANFPQVFPILVFSTETMIILIFLSIKMDDIPHELINENTLFMLAFCMSSCDANWPYQRSLREHF